MLLCYISLVLLLFVQGFTVESLPVPAAPSVGENSQNNNNWIHTGQKDKMLPDIVKPLWVLVTDKPWLIEELNTKLEQQRQNPQFSYYQTFNNPRFGPGSQNYPKQIERPHPTAFK